MFAQFTDEWVQDNLLFQYFSNGSCDCCNFSVSGKISEIMAQCTDVDSEDVRDTEESPWPQFVKEAVWKDRLAFRRVLKLQSSEYANFWRKHQATFSEFYKALKPDDVPDLVLLSIQEVHHQLARMGFEKAYRILLLTLLKQVECFRQTKYPDDGVTAAEKSFERALKGQTLNNAAFFTVSEEYLRDKEHGFLSRLEECTRPKILPREPQELKIAKLSSSPPAQRPQSFRSDRRLLRLFIFRMVADKAMKRFLQMQAPASTTVNDQEVKVAAAGSDSQPSPNQPSVSTSADQPSIIPSADQPSISLPPSQPHVQPASPLEPTADSPES